MEKTNSQTKKRAPVKRSSFMASLLAMATMLNPQNNSSRELTDWTPGHNRSYSKGARFTQPKQDSHKTKKAKRRMTNVSRKANRG